MADQIFEIKFHCLFTTNIGRIVDEKHNVYNGAEGWVTKDEITTFMNKFLEALKIEHLRRENIQKYKRCLYIRKTLIFQYERRLYSEDYKFNKAKFYEKWEKKWLELAEKFKEGK